MLRRVLLLCLYRCAHCSHSLPLRRPLLASPPMSRSLLLCVVLSVLFAVVLGGRGHGGFGGFQAILVQPVQPVVPAVAVQPTYVQPVVQQQKRVNYAQPIVTYAQPIVQAVRNARDTHIELQQASRSIAPFAADPLLFASLCCSSCCAVLPFQLDTTAPVMPDQSYTAAPIVQPTYQTAPVQNVQAITATAPTINKGYGAGLGLGSSVLRQY